MLAKLRKHRVAAIALTAWHFVFFFPVLFMGRVVSPNDVFYYYDPWALYRPASIHSVQNALMNDPATAWMTLMSMVRDLPAAFHWNPYIGAGVPGWGSSAAAVLSPLVFLPAFSLPLEWVFTGIIFLKLNLAFWFAYLWLRQERLGRTGAAIGAIIFAGAGVFTVRWLWQVTNATPLYPALLWLTRRAFDGKRIPVTWVTLIALAYALAGFPATMAYGAYICVAYAVYLAIRRAWRAADRPPVHATPFVKAAIGVALALMIAAPSIVPFAQLIRRSGYLEVRESVSGRAVLPLKHAASFVDPERLGNPATKNWVGHPSLGLLNNYIEATVYVGVVALLLALAGIFNRRARSRWFWVLAAAVILAAMFGLAPFIGTLPGFKYTALSRVVMLLPLPVAYLAAAAVGMLVAGSSRSARRHVEPRAFNLQPIVRVLLLAIALAAAVELAVFAGRFHPFLKPSDADVPATPTIRFLQNEPKPFRIATFLSYLWPNASELYRLEDISSHFGSEAAYRRLLLRIDPSAWAGTSTIIQLNSLNFNFEDPLVSMLGVRYLLEHRKIDIIRWTIHKNTHAMVKETGAWVLRAGQTMHRTFTIGSEPFWAIELPVGEEGRFGAAPTMLVELVKDARVVWSRRFTTGDIAALQKVYIPLKPYAEAGETVTLRVRGSGLHLRFLKAGAPAGESPLYFARVAIPLILDRELADGRIFRNLAEVPRFHAVRRLRKLNDEEFLQVRDVDFRHEAVITDDPVFPPALPPGDARVELLGYQPATQRLRVTSSAPTFVASSEKLTPELAVTIDSRPVKPVEINGLFAGVEVPAGTHEVVFSRRLARGWWALSAIGMIALALIAAAELIAWWRRE